MIVTRNNPILPRKNGIVPRKNPQSKVKKSKVKESKVNTPSGDDETIVSPPAVIYSSIEKTKRAIIGYVVEHKPTDIEPYKDLWNIFATDNGLSVVTQVSDSRKRKFRVRIKEPAFDFISILAKAKTSDFLKSHKWFGFDWIIGNEINYLKILEGNYDPTAKSTEVVNDGPTGREIQEQKAREILNG